MPPDYQNILILEGYEQEIRHFIEQAKGVWVDEDGLHATDFVFEKFIPKPKELMCDKPKDKQVSEVLIKKYGYDNLFDWQVGTLGIISEPVKVIFEKEKNKYSFSFLEEECPPLRALCAISTQFPSLKFFLEFFSIPIPEENIADHGKYEFVNGRMEVKRRDKCMF